MATASFQLVQKLFEKAIELPADHRPSFLVSARGDDAELRREVESLPEHHESADSGSLRVPWAGEPQDGDCPDQLIGSRIGQYLIESVLAIGGMGTVYLARQESPQREVALKVMWAGIATRNSILLIEFVAVREPEGKPLRDSLLQAGALRTRPILLTAGAAMLAARPITVDPIFSGLAWALIFGLAISTAFSFVVVPLRYCMVYARRRAYPGPVPGAMR